MDFRGTHDQFTSSNYLWLEKQHPMILHLKSHIPEQDLIELAANHEAVYFKNSENQHVFVLSSKIKEVPKSLESYVDSQFVLPTDIQLASKIYQQEKRSVSIGDLIIGGNSNNTLMIAGPCSVESREQIESVSELLQRLGIRALRAGCFKPRTSPYTFQGMGEDGLKLLAEMQDKYNFSMVTEVKDSSHVQLVIDYADVVQIGTKAMYDQSILRACGKAQKTILLKRGFGTTLQEFVQAAEFILSGGNENVILCERGIRTFEQQTRFTLDLTGVAFLKEYTNLPIVVDPSHAMGYRYGVPDLTRAAVAMGIDGLLIETHPTPEQAKSDASQQLNFEEFEKMYQSLAPIAQAIGKTMI